MRVRPGTPMVWGGLSARGAPDVLSKAFGTSPSAEEVSARLDPHRRVASQSFHPI